MIGALHAHREAAPRGGAGFILGACKQRIWQLGAEASASCIIFSCYVRMAQRADLGF